jgi:hypothetical protein
VCRMSTCYCSARRLRDDDSPATVANSGRRMCDATAARGAWTRHPHHRRRVGLAPFRLRQSRAALCSSSTSDRERHTVRLMLVPVEVSCLQTCGSESAPVSELLGPSAIPWGAPHAVVRTATAKRMQRMAPYYCSPGDVARSKLSRREDVIVRPRGAHPALRRPPGCRRRRSPSGCDTAMRGCWAGSRREWRWCPVDARVRLSARFCMDARSGHAPGGSGTHDGSRPRCPGEAIPAARRSRTTMRANCAHALNTRRSRRS